ncbi:MAG: Holliday junction resolvase RuvX [Acidimicrobiia bacterium]|nr:Holliday junction resolvase RuvX [Acidimicrobiia bacterium]
MLGVDLGTRRIGLAISDVTGTLATPLTVLQRASKPSLDHQAIVATAHDEEAQQIVVGLPRSLSGSDGPAARSVRDEVAELRAMAGEHLPVELHDERFTTVTATRQLREAGRYRGRDSVDAAAAAVILQSYLDGPGRAGRNV